MSESGVRIVEMFVPWEWLKRFPGGPLYETLCDVFMSDKRVSIGGCEVALRAFSWSTDGVRAEVVVYDGADEA